MAVGASMRAPKHSDSLSSMRQAQLQGAVGKSLWRQRDRQGHSAQALCLPSAPDLVLCPALFLAAGSLQDEAEHRIPAYGLPEEA